MTQKMYFAGLGGSGIVGTLIIAGIALKILQVSEGIGNLAIGGGVTIGIVLGLLGAASVAMRVFR